MQRFKQELNAVAAISFRDLIKFLRDRPRLLVTFIFPIIFIGILGKGLDANLSKQAGFDLLTFVFTGILAQVLFQSTASGVISLVEDREQDFSQAIFIAPVSRYSIIIGKIMGESLVALTQGIGVALFGFVVGVQISISQIISIIPIAFVACFFGGAFGVLILANLGTQRRANQIFPLLIFPQFFLSGASFPIKELPPLLFALSRITPMTYAVDLMRGVYYRNSPEFDAVTLYHPLLNITIIVIFFVIFLVTGTYLFVRSDRNR